MNRFKKRRFVMRSWLLSGLSVSLILAGAVYSFHSIETGRNAKEKENLEKALKKSAAICYALEGCYPECLQELREHYGIHWDETKYYVDYEAPGANLPPDITVIEISAGRRG